MKDPQRERIAAAFDRELAQSPVPPELRVQAVHEAVYGRDGRERQRPPRMLALVAALLAIAIVVTLLLTARSLRVGQVGPANPVIPANPIPLPKSGAIDPGTYFLANPNVDDQGQCIRACSAYSRIIFTLPAGWATGGGLVYKHLGQPDEVAFSAWSVRSVFADPCHWQQTTLSPLDITRVNWDEASRTYNLPPYSGGLANQALRNPLPRGLTRWTQAVDPLGQPYPTIALAIDLSVPGGLDISTCDKGEFRSWPVAYNGSEVTSAELLGGFAGNSHHASGQLDTVYMVSVDRWPLVIDVSHMPASSAADLAELKAILASMIIDRT